MIRWTSRLVVLLVLGLALSSVGIAAGAPATVEPDVDVQLWLGAQPGQTVMILSSTVPSTTPLPVTVRLPVPPGMQVDWAGEISGGSADQDLQREFELKSGTGGQFAEFRIEKFYQTQIEVSGIPVSSANGVNSTAVDYVQTTAADTTAFSVRIPAGASQVQIQPQPAGSPSKNQLGETLYTLPSRKMKPGDRQPITVSYSVGSAGVAGDAGGPTVDRGRVLTIVLGLLAAAILALVFALNRQRAQSFEPEDDEE